MDNRIFDLTPEQQKAFNRLKKAYSDCEKTGIYFFNNYGSLSAVDKNKICGYGDSKYYANGVSEISNHEVGEPVNSIKIANEWADDEHYYGLTEDGSKICFGE